MNTHHIITYYISVRLIIIITIRFIVISGDSTVTWEFQCFYVIFRNTTVNQYIILLV
jgi:hypothetical protein